MKSIFSTRRNKSPHNNEDQQKEQAPFFSKESKTPFFKGNNGIQTKLAVGQPGDKYEKEADSMADAVVNRSANKPNVQKKEISSIQRESLATPQEDEKMGTAEQRMEEDKMVQEKPELQRVEEPEEEMVSKMDQPEEEETVQAKEEEEEGMINKMDEEEEPIQTKGEEEEEGMISKMGEEEEEAVQTKEEEEEVVQTKSSSPNQSASNGLSQKIKTKSGKGRSLTNQTRVEMESSFGRDFSGVNIHTDQDAVSMNKELRAQAFTHGKDVYFNAGKYDPNSSKGKHLLAHELTHVVQQNNELRTKKKVVQTYRDPKAFNFNTDPTDPKKKNTGKLQEDSFSKKRDKLSKPWIENINIRFNGIRKLGTELMPIGNLSARYHPNAVQPMQDVPFYPLGTTIKLPKGISFPISGGNQVHGYTDSGAFKVTRIEGVGYNDMPFDKTQGEGPRNKYAKDLDSSMSFSVFFNGGQAIHLGSLTTASHSCVHVDWGGSADMGNTRDIQKLNYHAVKGLTKVNVSYDPSIIPELCCARLKEQGVKKGRGINPCHKVKAETC